MRLALLWVLLQQLFGAVMLPTPASSDGKTHARERRMTQPEVSCVKTFDTSTEHPLHPEWVCLVLRWMLSNDLRSRCDTVSEALYDRGSHHNNFSEARLRGSIPYPKTDFSKVQISSRRIIQWSESTKRFFRNQDCHSDDFGVQEPRLSETK